MSKPTMIVQRMKRSERDVYKRAQKYYMIVSAVNELNLTEREIQLVAFTAVRGNISYSNNRQEFCELYKSSPPTINNIISKLKRIGLFIKEGTKVKVNPVITLDFEKDVTLEIKIVKEKEDGEAS